MGMLAIFICIVILNAQTGILWYLMSIPSSTLYFNENWRARHSVIDRFTVVPTANKTNLSAHTNFLRVCDTSLS
jgi:hypothetical protein